MEGGTRFRSIKIAAKGANVAYRLLTVGGVLTVLNIKTTLKCLIVGIFLIKGII